MEKYALNIGQEILLKREFAKGAQIARVGGQDDIYVLYAPSLTKGMRTALVQRTDFFAGTLLESHDPSSDSDYVLDEHNGKKEEAVPKLIVKEEKIPELLNKFPEIIRLPDTQVLPSEPVRTVEEIINKIP